MDLTELKKPYAVGDRVWWKGERVTITTKPYYHWHAYWQDAKHPDGRTVTLRTSGLAH